MSVSFCMFPCCKGHSVRAYLDTIQKTLVRTYLNALLRYIDHQLLFQLSMQAQIFTFLRGKQMKLSCMLCSRYVTMYVLCTQKRYAKSASSQPPWHHLSCEFSLAYYVDPRVAGGVSKLICPKYLNRNKNIYMHLHIFFLFNVPKIV